MFALCVLKYVLKIFFPVLRLEHAQYAVKKIKQKLQKCNDEYE